jgi:hypothetical protein
MKPSNELIDDERAKRYIELQEKIAAINEAAAINSAYPGNPQEAPNSIVPITDVMREELAAIGPTSGIDFAVVPMKEEYQHILLSNPELIRDQTFAFSLGGKRATITPGWWVDGDDKNDSELYVSCTIKDDAGERIEKVMVKSFLEDLFVGALRPNEGMEAYAAKLLIYESLQKQKREKA